MLKPSILLIGNFLSAQGKGRAVSEDLAAELSAAGWAVRCASAKTGRLARVFDMARAVWRWRNEYTVAHVEVYSGSAFRWAELSCALLRLAGKPYLQTLHGGNLPAFARRWPERVRRLFAHAVAVTTPSAYLLEQMSVYRADLRLLPNPLLVEAYEFHPRAQPAPRLIWLRAFHAIYNPTLALRALSQLTAEFPDISLTMVGPDKGGLAHFQKTVAELGLNERVELPGAVAKSAVGAYLNQGDIFLNTTNVDNTPVSVLEAMACGLCVVSTNVGGIPYMLEHERDALLVPPDDPAAMAAAVRRLLTEPGLAEKLSRNARRKTEGYDWSFILPQWEHLLKTAARQGEK
jgi:glycosyltransferase involved in cell wall biosynthesis